MFLKIENNLQKQPTSLLRPSFFVIHKHGLCKEVDMSAFNLM